jgi:hypothetical protein
MKKTFYSIAYAAIITLGTISFIGCGKEEVNEVNMIEQLSNNEKGYPIKDDISGPHNPGKSCYDEHDRLTHCDYSAVGNCGKPITIVASRLINLDMVVSGGSNAVANFFSSSEWENYWPTIDNTTIEKLASGNYYLHKIERSENSYFYVATTSNELNTNEDYLIVLPVNVQ